MFTFVNSKIIVQFELLQYFWCHPQVGRVTFYKSGHINLQSNKRDTPFKQYIIVTKKSIGGKELTFSIPGMSTGWIPAKP